MGKQETRRLDGKPETTADRKFFDLRDSGYTGPIDHNGDAVLDQQRWVEEQRKGGR